MKKTFISIGIVIILFIGMIVFLSSFNFIKYKTIPKTVLVISPLIEDNYEHIEELPNEYENEIEEELPSELPPEITKPNTNKPSKPNISTENNKPSTPPKEELPIPAEPNKPQTVDDILAKMSLEEKIAQMVIISFGGVSMNSKLETSLTYTPGGVILFGDNITNYKTTKKLVDDIKNKSQIGPFISIDQEGGRVQRIKDIEDKSVATIPPMWDIGATKDINEAYLIGRTIGKDLKDFGINLDFAPVIDVVPNVTEGLIRDRSFGADANLVGQMGTSLAKGLNEMGLIPTYKHFPGHGATITDSHVSLPIVNKTKEELLNSDLIPFKEAIKNNAKVIMIGHLAVPKITSDNTPASLSKKVITDLLKNEMGYNNLVVTDALNMKALTNNYSEKEIYEMAINAGVDILLMPVSVESAVANIKRSIEEKRISEDKINKAARKILMLKKEYNII